MNMTMYAYDYDYDMMLAMSNYVIEQDINVYR
jgi:hypothetical protein